MTRAADRRPVLFVGHDATRSGAPLVLLHLLRWWRNHGPRPARLALARGGPLLADYAAAVPTQLLSPARPEPLRLATAAVERAGLIAPAADRRARRLRRLIGPHRPAAVYLNSVACLDLLRRMPPPPCPVVCHVHELEYAIRVVTAGWFDAAAARVDQFIAASGAVRTNLIDRHRVPAERVEVVYAFSAPVVPADSTADSTAASGVRPTLLRESLNLPPDALVVGAAGTMNWRKGFDLFVQLALLVRGRAAPTDSPVYFAWLGGTEGRLVGEEFAHDVGRAGLADRVFALGAKADPVPWIAGFDVLALTSREDPYPLVCLEAAAAGVPTVCFDRAGGMPEFVAGDCGRAVPYLDLPAMAEAVLDLLGDPAECRRLGHNARRKVLEQHRPADAAAHIARIVGRAARPAP